MKLIITEGAESVYNRSVDALFESHGDQRYFASGLPDFYSGVHEGHIKHIKSDETVACVNLQTCSGLFYIYSTGDIVAFHSPGGGLNFKGRGRQGAIGTPSEEAKYYDIGDYDSIRAVIASGYNTFRFSSRGSSRRGHVEYYLKEAYEKLFTLIRKEVSEDNIAVYAHASYGIFGINANGYIGEPGSEPVAVVTLPTMPRKKKKCFISSAVCSAMNKPDDCIELETLRWYRDQVLRELPGGLQAIREYEVLAPKIVAAIECQADANLHYDHICHTLVTSALIAIESGRYQDAFVLYRKGVLDLAEAFGLKLNNDEPANTDL